MVPDDTGSIGSHATRLAKAARAAERGRPGPMAPEARGRARRLPGREGMLFTFVKPRSSCRSGSPDGTEVPLLRREEEKMSSLY